MAKAIELMAMAVRPKNTVLGDKTCNMAYLILKRIKSNLPV